MEVLLLNECCRKTILITKQVFNPTPLSETCVFWHTHTKVLGKEQQWWAAFITLIPTEISVPLGCNLLNGEGKKIFERCQCVLGDSSITQIRVSSWSPLMEGLVPSLLRGLALSAQSC